MWSDSGFDDDVLTLPVKSEKEIADDRRVAQQYVRNSLDRVNAWAARAVEAGSTVDITKDENGKFVATFS